MGRMGERVKSDEQKSLEVLASEIFRKKKERRRQLALLSFEEKIDLLVRMQHLASEISKQARGTCKKPWWDIVHPG